MEIFERLDWDSNLFGFGVARLVPSRLERDVLAAVLTDLRASGITLVYWTSDGADDDGQQAARALNGFLADRKTTYLREATPLDGEDGSLAKPYDGPPDDAGLAALAIQSAEFSRFHVDPRMPPDAYRVLYRNWIRNSVLGTIADAVLVTRDGTGTITGMVTLGQKNGRGDIGLIAVDGRCRGQGLGRKLVAAALDFHRAAGLTLAQVVTQGDNLAACRFYERCGYHVETVQPVWHFWL